MKKLKSIFFVAGVMLLILSAVMAYLSIEELSAMLPADSYTDRGVYTFAPYEVASEQVKNTSASSRERRMNPTKTVYIICYRDIAETAIAGRNEPSLQRWDRRWWTLEPLWSVGCLVFQTAALTLLWSLTKTPRVSPPDCARDT